MTKRIIGLFSHSTLAVAPTLPPSARDASGTVAMRDEIAGTLALDDGMVFCLPSHFSGAALKPGTQVHLLYI